VKANEDAIGTFEWQVPHDFVKNYGKHGCYCFKIKHSPPQHTEVEESAAEVKKKDFVGTSLVGKTVVFETPVKATSDTFKIYDADKKKNTSSSSSSSPSVSAASTESTSGGGASVSVTASTSASGGGGEKQEKGVSASVKTNVSSAFGKATGLLKKK